MSNLSKIVLLLFCLPLSLLGQEDASLGWIKELAKEVQEETDLCERCTWIPPAISEIAFNNQVFYFLRYGCSTTESVARMYDPDGTFLGECKSNDDDFVCNPADVDAFLTYTFANKITVLWSCDTGFDCAFALANDIEPEVPIVVNDNRCVEGIKTLQVSDKFVTYEWGGGDEINTTAILEVTKGGLYSVTVTDEMDCIFNGEIDIPDITKLDVIIKGSAKFCLGTEVALKTTTFQSYQWSSGEKGATIIANQAGRYAVTVTNEQGCEGVTSFLLENFVPLPIEIIADQSKVFEGDPVNISVNTPTSNQPIIVAEWTSNSRIACKNCLETIYFPKIDNELEVSIVDENGCKSTATFFMLVKELALEVYTPNIFRPNNSAENNRFTLYSGANVEKVESLTIFDRWGNLIYSKKNFLPNQMGEGWNGQMNGTDVKQDVYLFQFEVLFTNGERKIVGGDILLLR